jgi:3'-phosphoadenosine 5'-phosphosulfate sulfotransferase (PAPS reductase)/FAD synthetase
MKQKLLIEFSGGRSSGFMTRMLLSFYREKYEMVVCFANTGEENEETLQFVNNCDKNFGFKTVWLEAVFGEKNKPTTFKEVTFETATRGAGLFENMCAKYGLPNVNYKHCTRELKLHPIHAYVKSLGWVRKEYKTAIGIRVDEPRRYKKEINKTPELFNEIALKEKKECWQKVVHPMVTMFPVTKVDVSDWWEDQSFNLDLENHQGNCKWCYKKSMKKHMMLMNEDISQFNAPMMLEQKYGKVGKNKVKGVYVKQPRKLFRNFMDTSDLIATFKSQESSDIEKYSGTSPCNDEECSTLENMAFELVSN